MALGKKYKKPKEYAIKASKPAQNPGAKTVGWEYAESLSEPNKLERVPEPELKGPETEPNEPETEPKRPKRAKKDPKELELELEPIPLRTLTLLLNYERMISDPRFHDVRLIATSLVDPDMCQQYRESRPREWSQPESVKHMNVHIFDEYPRRPKFEKLSKETEGYIKTKYRLTTGRKSMTDEEQEKAEKKAEAEAEAQFTLDYYPNPEIYRYFPKRFVLSHQFKKKPGTGLQLANEKEYQSNYEEILVRTPRVKATPQESAATLNLAVNMPFPGPKPVYTFTPTSEQLILNCSIHPYALPRVRALSFEQREAIYYETHSHNGCYKAIAMYQLFFSLCPPRQKLSIQLTNEEPVIINTQPRRVFQFMIRGPKLHTVVSIPTMQRVLVTGSHNRERHVVLAFPRLSPRSSFPTEKLRKEYILVDPTRQQYGPAGKGSHGETYFIGPFDEWLTGMANICEEVEVGDCTQVSLDTEKGTPHERMLRDCAMRVWKRWQKRDMEGWCEYCGIGEDKEVEGGPASMKLMRCAGCKVKKVWFCCREHQLSGWKLHRFNCESVKD